MKDFFYRILIKILFRIVDCDLKNRNDTAEREFLLELAENDGFRSYLAVRDLYLLKEMGQGVSQRQYDNIIGRRSELFYLAAKAQETKKLIKNVKK